MRVACSALAAAAASAPTSPAAATAQPAAAPTVNPAVCDRVFALVPSSQPWKDVSLGSVNGTSQNAPLGARDSSGLSRAELWVRMYDSSGSLYLQNVNTDTGTFAAASSGNFTGAAAVTKSINSSDSTQRWTEEQTGSWFKYRESNGRYLTFIVGNSSKPYQLYSNGHGGDQYFKKILGGCY